MACAVSSSPTRCGISLLLATNSSSDVQRPIPGMMVSIWPPSSPAVTSPASPDAIALGVVRRADAIQLPAGLIRLEARLRSGQSSATELGRLIAGSPALAARLLRTANSVFYSPLEPVTSVNRAIVVIGDAILSQIVIHAIMATRAAKTRSPAHALASARLMGDGVRSAVAARALAQLGGTVSPDNAFAAGLLHDLGHMLLLEDNPAVYAAHLAASAGPSGRLDDELALTGTTHEAVGGAFAVQWNLPEPLQLAMSDHHGSSVRAISLIVTAADHVVRGLYRPSFGPSGLEAVALREVGVSRAAWAGRSARTRIEMAEMLTIFDVLG